MKLKRPAFFCLLAIAAACANNAEITGTYLPSCVSFAGNSIELGEGRFTWDKFTDEVRVDDSGNVVEPFPAFPKRGSYAFDGDMLRLTTDAGELAGEMHVVRRPGQVYLLTAAEFDAWERDGTVPACALLLRTGD
jgi:hypothetical protein